MALKIVFAGTPEFAIPAFKALLSSEHKIIAVYTQPDRPAGRGRKLTASPVKQLAIENQISIFQPLSLSNIEEQNQLRQLQPDVMVVVAYGLILPAAILVIPRLGCINIHPSLLPRWRGAAPIQRAILAGDKETGVAIMQMDKGMDTGDILNQVKFEIDPNETSLELHNRCAEIGGQLLLKTLEDLQLNRAKPTKQSDNNVCYANKIEKAEAKIEWHKSSVDIYNQIRALNPWPVAFCDFNGQPLKIWQAELLSDTTDLPPGTIVNASKLGIDIATGDGLLRIVKVQLPGGRILGITDFLNAHQKDLIPGKTVLM